MQPKSYKPIKKPRPQLIDLTTCKHDVIRKKITKTVWREIGDKKILLGIYRSKQCGLCGIWFNDKTEL